MTEPRRWLVMVPVVIGTVAACGSSSTATPAAVPTPAPTDTPAASTPTATAMPSAIPTHTPSPTTTATRVAQATIAPTATATAEPTANGGTTLQASIQNFALEDLSVRVGDTVVWTQRDSDATHTPTSGVSANADEAWGSDWLQQGQTFSFTFTQPGTFPCFCTIHQSMTAVVTVMGVGSGGAVVPAEPTPASAEDDGMGSADDEYS